jgi:hypothetical protein
LAAAATCVSLVVLIFLHPLDQVLNKRTLHERHNLPKTPPE